jgi:hypothetical protein
MVVVVTWSCHVNHPWQQSARQRQAFISLFTSQIITNDNCIDTVSSTTYSNLS